MDGAPRMRLLLVLTFAAVVLAACHRREPKVSEKTIQSIHASEPGMTDECLNTIRWGGVQALHGQPEDCYKFDAPRRWKGLYFGEFEVSRFCPAPARQCSDTSPGEHIWLSASSSAGVPAWNGKEASGLFAMEFIGHKTSYPGHYGHLGLSDEEIVIDHLISMKQLERSP